MNTPLLCLGRMVLLAWLALAGLSGSARGASLPFHGGDTWTVCQGYNTREIDHIDGVSGLYALDFVTDSNAAIGTYGCNPAITGASGGKQIIAPTAGMIRHSADGHGEFICLRLDTPFGRIQSINFGHLDPARQGWTPSSFDTRVEAGEVLGTLRRTLRQGYGPAHLHMAAYAGPSCSGETVPFDDLFTGHNFPSLRDARQNLTVHQHYGVTVKPTLLPPSVVDGAGSLVDPAGAGRCGLYAGNGCSKDLVRLHPHGVPSTAVFQVLSQAGRCEYVNVSGLVSANIIVKRWSETYPGSEGDATSSVFFADRLPVSIPLPANKWLTLSVSSTSAVPAGQTRTVTVTCGTGAPPYGRPTDVAPPLAARAANPQALLLPLQGDHFWSGNASMITFSANASNSASSAGYGRTIDEVITLGSRKSLAMFQLFAEGATCRNIQLSDATGAAGRAVEVSTKLWDQAAWTRAIHLVLPARVTVDQDGYWLLKVKPSSIGWSKIRAQCV